MHAPPGDATDPAVCVKALLQRGSPCPGPAQDSLPPPPPPAASRVSPVPRAELGSRALPAQPPQLPPAPLPPPLAGFAAFVQK